MKEIAIAQRSSDETKKMKTKERRRRSITTKIFQSLRKDGGYHLPARADVNKVLRHFAAEAGSESAPHIAPLPSPNFSSLLLLPTNRNKSNYLFLFCSTFRTPIASPFVVAPGKHCEV